ncbi:MAG: TIGR00296 family protein, partial [Candidatus Kariarchaeaceae archaeon]
GCIGIPYPQYPLAEAVAISARNSAIKDPRFPPIQESELDKIIIEVEVLSPIIQIKFDSVESLSDQITVGNDGLIIKFQDRAGLLLPKVGARYGWTSLDLIHNTCKKAMLPIDALEWDEIEVFKFQSELYA